MLVLSFYLPMALIRNLKMRSIDIRADVALCRLKIKKGHEQLDAIKNRLGPGYQEFLQAVMESNGEFSGDFDKFFANISEDDVIYIRNILDTFPDVINEVDVDSIKLQCALDKLEVSLSESESMSKVKWVGISIGFLFVFLGFSNWYLKQQVYVDRAYENYCISVDKK